MTVRIPRIAPAQPPAAATAIGAGVQGVNLDRQARGFLHAVGVVALRETHHVVEHDRSTDLLLTAPTGDALDLVEFWPSPRTRHIFVGLYLQAHEDKAALIDPPFVVVRVVEEVDIVAVVDATNFTVAGGDVAAFTDEGFVRVDLGAGDEVLKVTDIVGNQITHDAGSRQLVASDTVRAVVDRGINFPAWAILAEPEQTIDGGDQVDVIRPRYVHTPGVATAGAGRFLTTVPRMLNVFDRQGRQLTLEVETRRCRVLSLDILEPYQHLVEEQFAP